MVTCCVMRTDCSHHVDRTEVPKYRHFLQFALTITIIFGHDSTSQCEAVFRNHCFAERFGAQLCHVFLTLDSSHSQPLGSDFIARICIVVNPFPIFRRSTRRIARVSMEMDFKSCLGPCVPLTLTMKVGRVCYVIPL